VPSSKIKEAEIMITATRDIEKDEEICIKYITLEGRRGKKGREKGEERREKRRRGSELTVTRKI
jgi:SET domain-containing protein